MRVSSQYSRSMDNANSEHGDEAEMLKNAEEPAVSDEVVPWEDETDNMGQKNTNSKIVEGTPLNNKAKKQLNYATIITDNCIHGKSDCDCNKKDTVVACREESMSGSDHCHTMDSNEGTNKAAKRKLIIASVLCLFFMVIEIVGSYLSSSLAIATDVGHLLTDFASFMISLFAIWISQRRASKRMSYGWHRAEVIGALTSVLLIWVVTGILVYVAINRIITDDYDIQSTYMLITASVGVFFNIVMGCALHYGALPHGHSHGGSSHDVEHGHGHSHADANSNINVRAALIHVIGDVLQSMGVFVAAIIIHFKPEYRIVDPICTFVFSVLVLITTITILKETIVVLMEGKPKGIDFQEVREMLTKIDGVKHVHNLRIWALTLEKTVLSTHVGIEPGTADYHRVQKECVRMLRDNYTFHEVTVQVEEWNPTMLDCYKCNEIAD